MRPEIAETSLGTVVTTSERGKVAASETVEAAAIVAGLDKVTQTGTRTQKAYTRALRMLVDVYGKRPEEINEAELSAYFLCRKNVDRWSSNTLCICHCGIRIYFVHVLGSNFGLFNILHTKSQSQMPAVLNRDAARSLLGCVRSAHNRAFLARDVGAAFPCATLRRPAPTGRVAVCSAAARRCAWPSGCGTTTSLLPIAVRRIWRSCTGSSMA